MAEPAISLSVEPSDSELRDEPTPLKDIPIEPAADGYDSKTNGNASMHNPVNGENLGLEETSASSAELSIEAPVGAEVSEAKEVCYSGT